MHEVNGIIFPAGTPITYRYYFVVNRITLIKGTIFTRPGRYEVSASAYNDFLNDPVEGVTAIKMETTDIRKGDTVYLKDVF